jgi:hypothetical protein
MKLLTLLYHENEKSYTYSFSKDAPLNCQLLDYYDFSKINIIEKSILFIGSIWYGNVDVVLASVLAEVAVDYPDSKFYFKIILDEKELVTLVPKEFEFTHLPIILLMENSKWKIISTGLIRADILTSKIAHELGG